MQVVAELLQEAQDVRDAADCRQGQGVLLLVEEGWTRKTRTRQSNSALGFRGGGIAGRQRSNAAV